MVKRVFDANTDLMIEFEIDGSKQVVSARRILDLKINDPETEFIREEARQIGTFVDEKAILDEDAVVIATRIDYVVEGQKASYFSFCHGFDDTGWPIVEPTVDDVEEALQEGVYRLRWEMANNRSVISLSYMGGMDVESVLLILPDNYQSSFADNHELRRVAIDEGVFRPFPL